MVKKPGPAKGTGGRPLVPIDWELATKLAKIQCTAAEIAAVLEINQDTLADRCKRDNGATFSEWFKKVGESGKVSLRRSLWKMATGERPHAAVAIWLSKNYLGMSEKFDIPDDKKMILSYSQEYLKPQSSNEK
jgi:hypothetical protein